MPSLSYVITTRNKLPYLREVVDRLVKQLEPDDEIVVVDGASTDGSAEYLADLYRRGLIHQFISEPDKCQAHGANKGLLLARGDLIKIMTDDDVLCLSAVNVCKRFMLEHPDVDVLNGNTADANIEDPSQITLLKDYEQNYREWREGRRRAFWFGDQSVFYRRSSLPLIGLWHTGVACIDVEQTLRLTALRQVKLAWYTGVLACALKNPNSLTFAKGHFKRNARDVRKLYLFYAGSLPGGSVLGWPKRALLRSRLFRRRLNEQPKPTRPPPTIAEAYDRCEQWMQSHNASNAVEILCS